MNDIGIRPLKEQVTAKQVSEQLDRMRQGIEIRSSQTLIRFLEFVVQETLLGNGGDLKEYTIGTRALKRPADFNPQLDPIVRIHATRLRRMMNLYYNGSGKNDPVRIEIPKGTYIPQFAINQNGSNDLPSKTMSLQPGKGFGYKLTIALFPLRYFVRGGEVENLALSLNEQLCLELSRFADFSVLPFYSSWKFTDHDADHRQAITMQKAHYVLSGSLIKDQDSIRINIQLIFAETAKQVWIKTYDLQHSERGYLFDLGALAYQIAIGVAGYFGAIVHDMAKASPGERDKIFGCHDAVFWYYHYHTTYDQKGIHKAQQALEQAVVANPSYALAHAILSETYMHGYINNMHSAGILNDALQHARTAIRLDRHCQLAYQVLAWAYMLQKDRKASLKTIDELISIDPNTPHSGWLGLTLISMGEYERGGQLIEQAIQLNPFYPWSFSYGMTCCHYHWKNYAEALLWAEKVNMPHLRFDTLMRTAILGQLKDVPGKEKSANELLQLWPNIETECLSFLNRYLDHEGTITHILQGLSLAGISVSR